MQTRQEMMVQTLVLFTASYPYGKSEQFLETEIAYLSKAFEKIIIIPSEIGGRRHKREVPTNVEVRNPILPDSKLGKVVKGLFNLTSIRPLLKEFLEKRVILNPGRIKPWLSATLQIRAMLASLAVKSVIHGRNNYLFYFYWGFPTTAICCELRNKTDAIIISRFHRGDIYEEHIGGYLPFRKLIYNNIDEAVFISKHGLEYVKKKYPWLKCNTIVSRLGVTDGGTAKSSSDDIIRLVTCSRLVPFKRVDLLIRALRDIKRKMKLTIIGSGSEEKKLRTLAATLPKNIIVDFKGYMSNNQVRQYYQKEPVDLFVNVSNSEGVPVSAMEALSAGIPVLATNAGGTSEIVDNKVGMLVDKDITRTELKTYIQHISNLNEKEYFQLRMNAKKRWEDLCNAEHIYPKFASHLKKLKQHKLFGSDDK